MHKLFLRLGVTLDATESDIVRINTSSDVSKTIIDLLYEGKATIDGESYFPDTVEENDVLTIDKTIVFNDGIVLSPIETRGQMEKRFVELLDGNDFFPITATRTYYFKNSNFMYEVDGDTNSIYTRYEGFWDIFEKEFHLEYEKIRTFLETMFMKYLKVESTFISYWSIYKVKHIEKQFKRK